MVNEQIRDRGISDERILRAFSSVRRHLFVPPDRIDEAYADYPLPIGEGQTISQPYIVALMTAVIRPQPRDIVLEIGTGSGYQAAILSRLVRRVYSIEIKAALAERAQALLARLGYGNISVSSGDGYQGWKEHAPYDGIVVTCAAPAVPAPLFEQLAAGGRLVIPLGEADDIQELVLYEKNEKGRLTQKKLIPVRFVPFLREGK
jgi:protein-L-isoaspartate(D-aspartate) O-methyltransferase